jgi:hypothetical protein
MLTENISVHFIQSLEARSEYVLLGDDVHIIIDRQASLYINAIDFSEFYSEVRKAKFEDELYSAFIFIAATDCFYLGNCKIARELHETYIRGNYSYYYPRSIGDEAIRLSFTFYHEWGHSITDKCEKNKTIDNVGRHVDNAFKAHQDDCIQEAIKRGDREREIFYSDFYENLYSKYNKYECTADLFSAVKVLEILDKDAFFRGMIGGKSEFIHKSLVSIYQIELINYFRGLIKLALNDDPLPVDNRAYTEERNSRMIQRIRLSRQILISILQAEEGAKVAENTFNQFTEYLQKIDPLVKNILFPKIYKFINFLSSMDYDYEDTTDDEALQYCMKEMYWHDD